MTKYLVGALVALFLFGTSAGTAILNQTRDNAVGLFTVKKEDENIVFNRYQAEIIGGLSKLKDRIRETRKHDRCLVDADQFRRSNSRDGSIGSVDRFCE